MEERQRQLVLLVGFMGLLVAVVLFVAVYAPDPIIDPELNFPLPNPLKAALDAVLKGFEVIVEVLGSIL